MVLNEGCDARENAPALGPRASSPAPRASSRAPFAKDIQQERARTPAVPGLASVFRLWCFTFCAVLLAATAQADVVDDIVKTEMARSMGPGVVVGIVGQDGKAVTRRYGLANVELNVPVSDKTIFQSGSVGKQFTTVAVMLLVEEGKIKLDAPITTYFKGAPKWWGTVTVRHLLTHTSGLPDYGQELDLWKNHSEGDLETYFHTLKPLFAPGAKWSYSNPGYALLGILVRKVSGTFYGDMLKARVFAPLGMTSARVISEADLVMNRADGYITIDGALKNQEWVAPAMNTTADGALYLTVLDLIAWDRGLRQKAILKPESWALVYTPVKLNDGTTHPYGFGWFIETVAGELVLRHSGSWQGFTAMISRYHRRGLTIIVLANHADFGSRDVAEKIGAALP